MLLGAGAHGAHDARGVASNTFETVHRPEMLPCSAAGLLGGWQKNVSTLFRLGLEMPWPGAGDAGDGAGGLSAMGAVAEGFGAAQLLMAVGNAGPEAG